MGSMPQLKRNKRRAGSNTPPPQEIKLRKVVPVLPKSEAYMANLMEDLTAMGCQGLAEKPWGFKEQRVIQELVYGAGNQYDNSNRGHPHRWSEDMFRAAYGFREGGSGLAGRKDEFVVDKFRNEPHPKDGFTVEECLDERQRRMLQFLVPILHPEKPTRVTVTLGNTIFGALSGDRPVDWARIIYDLVGQLIQRIGKSRATPLCPYVYHLYKHQQLLTANEDNAWKLEQGFTRFGTSEDEGAPDSGEEEESEREEEDRTIKLFKTTPANTRGTPEGQEGVRPEDRPSSSRPPDLFEALIDILSEIRADWTVKRKVISEVAALVGGVPDDKLPERVGECITNPEEAKRLQAETTRMQIEVDRLQAEVVTLRDSATATKEMAGEAGRMVAEIKTVFGVTGEVSTRARLFQEEVHKENKISGTRLIRILTEFSDQVEKLLAEARKAADRMEESSKLLVEVPVRLSELSIPDLSLEAKNNKGKDKTPQSSRAGATSKLQSPNPATIILDSSSQERVQMEEDEPQVLDGERNRNLAEVFEGMEVPDESPTSGSRVRFEGEAPE